ncbi:hypothetical protein UlMin_030660 [Ulmus minor]
MVKKPTRPGRKKIPISKIQNQSNLQVTFSKRRSGIFKKASELCTLCGVEIGIIVFSPAGKPFAFGHPEVDSIINRILTLNTFTSTTTNNQTIDDQLSEELTSLLSCLEAEKMKGKELDRLRKDGASQCWWEAPIEELGLEELEQLKVSMEDLKNNVTRQAQKMTNLYPHYYFSWINGVGQGDFERNLSTEVMLGTSSTIPNHVYNLGYGYGHGHF